MIIFYFFASIGFPFHWRAVSTLRGADQIVKLQQQFPLVCRLYFQFQLARRQVKDCDPARFASQSLRVESDAARYATSVAAAARSSPRITASCASALAPPAPLSSGLSFGSAPPSPSLSSAPSSRLPASIATLEDVFIHADRAANDDDARLFGGNGQHAVIDNVESSGGMVYVDDDDHVSDSEERLRDDEKNSAAVKRRRDDAATVPIADSATVEISSSSSSSAFSSTSSASLPSDDADLAADAAVHCLSYEAHLPALDLVVGPRQRQRVFASLTTRLMSETAYLAFARARTVSFACGSARTAFLHAIGSGGADGSSTTTSALHATALTLLGLIAWYDPGSCVLRCIGFSFPLLVFFCDFQVGSPPARSSAQGPCRSHCRNRSRAASSASRQRPSRCLL